MTNYQSTVTWQKIFGDQQHIDECTRLKVEYEKFRANAALLAEEISSYLPGFTVHNITHIDALWEMADIFLPEDFSLNPAECFVLGGAFLLHDLGMIVAAYPDRMQGVQQEEIWKDTVAQLSKQRRVPYDLRDPSTIAPDISKAATEKTLRILHAKRAKELAQMQIHDNKGNVFYLIDDETLRNTYGTIIGEVAESHWMNCEELPNRFVTTLGAPSCFPNAWSIDPLKLACIVRVADAMNIDDRRAPSLLNAIREKDAFSEQHWLFQGKLNQPRIEHRRVVYTSKSAFGLQEIDAWWLCYDTLKMIDRELKCVDALLQENRGLSFSALGVYGIDNIEVLQRVITVADWKPVDTSIRVNNVAKLVSTLGGTQLYGNDYLVPLREIVQNAADAIRARRCIDGENSDYGDIILSIGKEGDSQYIQLEDNGIGMSPNVMVNALLDFGQSFWGSDRMHDEFPGLEQTTFRSTGKFGIGFFSVFMWGDRVEVISNRYDKGRDCTMVLDFSKGVNGRPILRKARRDEQIKNGGTRIKVWLKSKNINDIFQSQYRDGLSQEEKIARLCFSLDCNLYLESNSKRKLLIQANDWQDMNGSDFLYRLLGHNHAYKLDKEKPEVFNLLCNNLRLLKEESGEIVGRACLYNRDNVLRHNSVRGVITVDGFAATELSGIVGVLKGDTDRASRDIAIPIVSTVELDRWCVEQARLLLNMNCSEKTQMEIAEFCCTLSRTATDLKIARWKNDFVNFSQIREHARQKKHNRYILVQDAAISVWERDHNQTINLAEDVYVCSMGMPGVLQTRNVHSMVSWPRDYLCTDERLFCAVVVEHIINAISQGWDCPVETLLEYAEFSTDDKHYNAVIGYCGEQPIEMRVDIVYLPEENA